MNYLVNHNHIPIRPRFCLGLDLGRQVDFSALAALRFNWPAPTLPIYEVPTLKRWALGTAYLTIVAEVVQFLKALPATGAPPFLVIDATGVGDAVFEMVGAELLRAKFPVSFCGVTITAGSAVSLAGHGRWHVAKKQLVSVLQVLLGQRRLQIAPTLSEAMTLQRELGAFKVKITESANETYESWREADHDDLVLAAGGCSRSGIKVFREKQPDELIRTL